jgi:3-deoxy-manno-octulosonate cytidylyltransferase (CMP-KDO synthetase)
LSAPTGYVIVIPARYDSQRLPGKLLLEVQGKPLLEHVWKRAGESGASQVVIATDDDRILHAAQRFGARVEMTASSHRSGSDRIAECAAAMGWDREQIIVNLQGDEPLMPPDCLDQVAKLLETRPDADVATLYAEIESDEDVHNPNVVKVVAAANGQALYFSRSAIPAARDFATVGQAMRSGLRWRRHVGLYAYRRQALDWFSTAQATPLECAEKLEQLRFLEGGRQIVLGSALKPIPAGVDTPDDLERIRRLIKDKTL